MNFQLSKLFRQLQQGRLRDQEHSHNCQILLKHMISNCWHQLSLPLVFAPQKLKFKHILLIRRLHRSQIVHFQQRMLDQQPCMDRHLGWSVRNLQYIRALQLRILHYILNFHMEILLSNRPIAVNSNQFCWSGVQFEFDTIRGQLQQQKPNMIRIDLGFQLGQQFLWFSNQSLLQILRQFPLWESPQHLILFLPNRCQQILVMQCLRIDQYPFSRYWINQHCACSFVLQNCGREQPYKLTVIFMAQVY